MKKLPCLSIILIASSINAYQTFGQSDKIPSFRVLPYLLSPSSNGIHVNWFTENNEEGLLKIYGFDQKDTIKFESDPMEVEALMYSALEESEKAQFPDMFINKNFKHSIAVKGLHPDTKYKYMVLQNGKRYEAQFKTAPLQNSEKPIRFVAFADAETSPEGRKVYRKWEPGAQAPGSTGRPAVQEKYFVTEHEGYQQNLKIIKERNPDFLLISGDLVQGGGYQRAWDEFFFHNAGKFDNPLSYFPLIPAIGNWENFGARNGGYEPQAIAASRAKYAAYFDAPFNNNPNYKNFYYRIDYGPVTILTLDSSNGLPDSTDQDTNININISTYPGNDLPDINPGSDQWNWAIEQLRDAHKHGQLIFVQFHHVPYASGGHILPLTTKGSSGQAGIPMRAYTPEFKKYGVIAVFCGHNESFEHSVVEGIHFYDVGVAGDGLGYAQSKTDNRFENPHRQWVAHYDAEEHWEGKKLISGGKHYGHLEVNVTPLQKGNYEINFTPVHIFPVTNKKGQVIDFERRIYNDEMKFSVTGKVE
jgi:3',5'-cyclic AMP phosphodiesterase CpdA